MNFTFILQGNQLSNLFLFSFYSSLFSSLFLNSNSKLLNILEIRLRRKNPKIMFTSFPQILSRRFHRIKNSTIQAQTLNIRIIARSQEPHTYTETHNNFATVNKILQAISVLCTVSVSLLLLSVLCCQEWMWVWRFFVLCYMWYEHYEDWRLKTLEFGVCVRQCKITIPWSLLYSLKEKWNNAVREMSRGMSKSGRIRFDDSIKLI